MVNKQGFLNAFNQDFDMVRGDTLNFSFQLQGLGSQAAYNNLNIIFAVAEHYDDEPYLFGATKGQGITLEEYDSDTDTATFSVYIAPELTKSLELMRYYYDLQIKDTSNVITLMRGRLTLIWDVAD